MRVVHVNCARDPKRRTGADLLDAWPTLVSVASAVKGAGVDIAVVQSSHEDATCERDGIAIRFVAEPWIGRPAAGYAPWRLARAVKALQPDVIHVNGLGFPFHTRALCALGQPVLVQDHAAPPRSRMRGLRSWGLAKIAGVAFTASEQAAPFFLDESLKPQTPVFSILESSTHFRDGDTAGARIATGLHGHPAILWVGHLNANKDPITILEAFSRALPRIPEAHLSYCFRHAPLLDCLRARLAANPDLSARVHLLGAVPHEQVELLCRAADIFVLGSKRESCGYALLEALACGATPIVSDIPAFRAITAHGAIGTLCNPGDIDAFAHALVTLSDHALDALREKAVRHFKSELSFPAVGKKLAAAYQALMDRHANLGSDASS
ncbi:MAG TPA: glycosyltransferase family 4 protein [Rhizomicrobium sp.]|nr:glycosyltransferase family 4 protein [Rhizomicrobium sp.]